MFAGGYALLPAEPADEVRLLHIARPIAADFQAGEARGEPRRLAEAFGPAHGDLVPLACLRNGDEASDDLRVLARGGEPVTPIRECPRAIREVVVVANLDEARPDHLWHGQRSPHGQRFRHGTARRRPSGRALGRPSGFHRFPAALGPWTRRP